MQDEKNKKPNQTNGNGKAKEAANNHWWTDFLNIFNDVIDLKHGLDRYGTILSIRKNIEMKGINVWLLICAIMVASVGLDKNSPAVIIGGMLISPLMFPILGIGLSLAINDKNTLLKSLENFGAAVLITLVTSTIYFLLTPYGRPNVEIMSRTSPDIMDVFVGFFGGIAGIVAGSRKDGAAAAIPGVAIATALLPPICVAGYGLAKLNMSIFIGAFYLFILNTFFITIATFLVVRYLKFPFKEHASEKLKRQARNVMVASSIIIVIPSFFFLRNSVQDIRLMKGVENFVINHLETDEIRDFGWHLDETDTSKVLIADVYVEDLLSESQVDSLEQILESSYRLRNVRLKMNQIEAGSNEIIAMQESQTQMKTDIERAQEALEIKLAEQEQILESIRLGLQQEQKDSIIRTSIVKELSAIYKDDINSLSIGQMDTDLTDSLVSKQFTLIVDWKKKYYQNVLEKRTQQITEYARVRHPGLDTIYVIHR